MSGFDTVLYLFDTKIAFARTGGTRFAGKKIKLDNFFKPCSLMPMMYIHLINETGKRKHSLRILPAFAKYHDYLQNYMHLAVKQLGIKTHHRFIGL